MKYLLLIALQLGNLLGPSVVLAMGRRSVPRGLAYLLGQLSAEEGVAVGRVRGEAQVVKGQLECRLHVGHTGFHPGGIRPRCGFGRGPHGREVA